MFTCGCLHLAGVLVNYWKALNVSQPFILLAVSRTVPRKASRYQLLNVDKANADSGLTDRLNFFWFVFVNFDCIICIYYNCSQHTMFIQFVIYSRYKNIGYEWRDIKAIPIPVEFYRPYSFILSFNMSNEITDRNRHCLIYDPLYRDLSRK